MENVCFFISLKTFDKKLQKRNDETRFKNAETPWPDIFFART